MQFLDQTQVSVYLREKQTHCALSLRQTAQALWQIDALQPDDSSVTLRMAVSESAALRHMGEVYRRTAASRSRKVRIGFSGDLWTAAGLAGRLGIQCASFLPMAQSDILVLLLYSGSLRTSPPL